MLGFLKRLFGTTPTPNPRSIATQIVRQNPGGGGGAGMRGYFSTMGAMQEAISARDYAKAAKLARKNLDERAINPTQVAHTPALAGNVRSRTLRELRHKPPGDRG